MIRAHTVAQVRAAEEALLARLPEGALMQRAAHGLAHGVLDLLGGGYGRRVLLLVGPGNNGGDALFAGVVLARRGVQVTAWLLAEQVHEAGLTALRGAGGRVVSAAAQLVPDLVPDLVVDGVLGIGGRPGLAPNVVAALDALAGVPIVAVDTPSGVGVDTGTCPAPHVNALATITFGTHKLAHLLDPAAAACGAVHLVPLGLELPPPAAEALQADDVALLLPRPNAHAHKYTRGVVGVRCGSAAYLGAGVLAVAGASCGVAGMVRHVGEVAVHALVRERHPEVVGAGRVQAWVVGSGSGDDAPEALAAVLADGVPAVVDADALAHLAPADGGPHLILTPHAGELARMLGVERAEVEADPLAHAVRAAGEWESVVLLKGRRSVIVHPDGRVRVNLTGTPWLATAGAGDVLGGVIAALAAAGLAPLDAASVGAWLHGAAAATTSRGGPIVASDVAAALPAVMAGLLAE